MRFASIFTTLAIVIKGDQDCNYALELLALQDGSDSFAYHVEMWASAAGDLIERLGMEFEEFKIGLSSFTDKPIPKSGYGMYGGWNEYKQDYCYKGHVALTTSVQVMTDGLNDLKDNMGSGMDASENQAEAMINAALDSRVGWSDPSVTHTKSGRPIVRVLMLITDEKAHEEGDAATNIANYNAVRRYPNGYDQPSTGGFGAHDFPNKMWISSYLDEESSALYAELADLFAKTDRGVAEGMEYRTVEEITRMEELIALWGPYPHPDSLVKHPGDASLTDCSKTEYPSLTQTMEALSSRHILPVILTSTETAYAFYEWYQENVFSSFNMSTVISMFNSNTLFDDMISAISSVVDKECLIVPTTAPVVPASTVDATSPAAGHNDDSNDGSTLGESNEVTEAPVITDALPSASSDFEEKPFTTSQEDPETDETTEYIQPPIVPPAGSNTATIAGASAGAVAGAAGVAALLYKQFGATMFGGNTAPTADLGQMEATPEVMEREALEEVTTDMFH